VHNRPLNPNPGSIISPPPSHAATRRCCTRAHAPAPRHLTSSTVVGSTPAPHQPPLGPHSMPAPPPCLPRRHAASTIFKSTPTPSQPPPRRWVPDDSNISRSSPLSPSIDYLSLRKLIHVSSICRLGTDSSIVHLLLRN
jgi:hypothetical protein